MRRGRSASAACLSFRQLLTIAQKVLPVRVIWRVDGDGDGFASSGHGSLHMLARTLEIRTGIKLKPQRAGGRFADLLYGITRVGTDHHDRFSGACRTSHRQLALRMRLSLTASGSDQ